MDIICGEDGEFMKQEDLTLKSGNQYCREAIPFGHPFYPLETR